MLIAQSFELLLCLSFFSQPVKYFYLTLVSKALRGFQQFKFIASYIDDTSSRIRIFNNILAKFLEGSPQDICILVAHYFSAHANS